VYAVIVRYCLVGAGREVMLQPCFGSALARLEASFAFTFHFEKFEQKDLEAMSDVVSEALFMFGKTARAVLSGREKRATGVESLQYETSERLYRLRLDTATVPWCRDF